MLSKTCTLYIISDQSHTEFDFGSVVKKKEEKKKEAHCKYCVHLYVQILYILYSVITTNHRSCSLQTIFYSQLEVAG